MFRLVWGTRVVTNPARLIHLVIPEKLGLTKGRDAQPITGS